jgi:alpha-ketoglutarate-dependent taurine dioxygenase
MKGLQERLAHPGSRMPLTIEPVSGDGDLAAVIATHAASLQELLLEHGALLFRGFGVRDVQSFDQAVAQVSPRRLDYLYRSTPRTAIGDRVFTATEYPADQEIPFHSENAYQRVWPLRIAFACLTPASSGGETPIADLRRVSAVLGQALMDEFESRCVRYTRHYRPHVDLPWQTVFQTSDRAALASYCARHDIVHAWLDGVTLRTMQVCQGTARHPVTRDRVFFNHAHLFHVSSLGAEAARSMLAVFGPQGLPRHASFGDGGEISMDLLERIRAAFRAESVTFEWQAGDLMLLDNMQVAHGRRPFGGTRRVLAALLDPSSG